MTSLYIAGGIVAVALLVCLQFPLARMRATSRRLNQLSILWGAAQFVRWELNEIVIFERNGKLVGDLLETHIKENLGGARFIYPALGEAVGGRVGLGIQSLIWKDTVNIQESIPCNIEVAVWWAVDPAKVSDYFFRNDLNKHPHESKEVAARNAAEADLKKLTGARVRKVVSQADFQISFIEMLILKQSEYRAGHRDSNADSDAPLTVANIYANLERSLQAELNPEKLNREALNYGLRVDRIEVQSINWAAEVQRPILETLLGRLKPEQAKSQAAADRIIADTQTDSYEYQLRKVSGVLGVPVTQMRELLQHLPDGSNDTKEEMAKAIISEFKRLRLEAGDAGQEIKKDEIEPPKDKSGNQTTDEFDRPENESESSVT